MRISEVTREKKRFLPLLLLADEQESMIDRYLDRGTLYVLEEDGVKSLCVVTDEGSGVLELKNLATEPAYQRRGYASRLISFLRERYRDSFRLLQVGTGDSPLTVPFYEKQGFVRSHRVKDFFLTHYDHPIYEGGRQLTDMVYLQMPLLPASSPLSPCQELIDRDPLRCLDLTEPVRRGEGTVITATEKGALVALNNYDREGRSVAFSLLARDRDTAGELLSLLPQETELIFAHEDHTAALAADRFGLTLSPAYRSAAYCRREPPPLPESCFQVRALTLAQLPEFTANYAYEGEEYFRWLVERRAIFGVFDQDTLMGFIGRHKEGSIGLLEILPAYRRHGLGRLLETYMIGLELRLGHIPYGQIFENNSPSLALQSSLGMTFSPGLSWFASR